MNRDNILNYSLGAVSYCIFLIIMFTKGLNFIFGIALIPISYIFPSLNDPNIGMAGLPFWLLSGLIGIFILPLIIFWLAKIVKVKVSLSDIFIGFLLSVVIANVVKLLFDLIMS